MVGPISSEERSAFARKLKLGLTALVGVSMALTAHSAGASLIVVLGALVGGLLAGAALVWFVFPGSGETTSRDAERRRRFR